MITFYNTCTGYRPILDTAYSFACDSDKLKTEQHQLKCSEMNNIEKIQDVDTSKVISTTTKKIKELSTPDTQKPPRPGPFPKELKKRWKFLPPLKIDDGEVCWIRPINLNQLLSLKEKYGKRAKLVGGNTEVGIETKFKGLGYTILLSTTGMFYFF